ncbi:MAG: hypothetical protein TUN42_03220 [Dehalogenimonas sp.]
MEITNVVICRTALTKPDTALTPILALQTGNLASIKNIDLPTWMSFIGGQRGTKYTITLEIASDVCGVFNNGQLSFVWDTDNTTCCTIFNVKFNPMFFGVHTFTFKLGDSVRSAKLYLEKI